MHKTHWLAVLTRQNDEVDHTAASNTDNTHFDLLWVSKLLFAVLSTETVHFVRRFWTGYHLGTAQSEGLHRD